MNVIRVALKLDEIKSLWEEIRETPVSKKVATVQDVAAMSERIEAVFDRYENAIQNDEQYIPLIRRELNRIILTLKRWIEYDEQVWTERFEEWKKYL